MIACGTSAMTGCITLPYRMTLFLAPTTVSNHNPADALRSFRDCDFNLSASYIPPIVEPLNMLAASDLLPAACASRMH